MSSSTSSVSILTTVPVTMSPSSNSTIVASTASDERQAAEVVEDDDRCVAVVLGSPPPASAPALSSAPRRRRSSAAVSALSAVSAVVRCFRSQVRRRLPAVVGDGGVDARPASCSDKTMAPEMGTARDRRGPVNEARRDQATTWLADRSQSRLPGCGRRASSRSSGWSRVGASVAVRDPGVTPWTAVDVEPGALARAASSSRAVKHVVQRSKSRSSPARSRTVGELVEHAGRGVEALAVLEAADREGGGERGDARGGRRAAAPRAIRPKTSASSSTRRAARTRPGRGRSRRRTRRRTARSRTSSTSKVAGEALGGRGVAGEARRSPADGRRRRTSMPRRASASEWRPGPQPTSSTRMPRLEPERARPGSRPPARCPS